MLTLVPEKRYEEMYVTIDIPPKVRDDLRGLYETGILEAGLCEGDHMHSLYTASFRLAVEETLDNLITYDYPTAKMGSFENIWRQLGSFESLSDFFGNVLPTPAELCLLLAPVYNTYRRTIKDGLAIDRVYLGRSMNYFRVKVELCRQR